MYTYIYIYLYIYIYYIYYLKVLLFIALPVQECLAGIILFYTVCYATVNSLQKLLNLKIELVISN